MVTKRIPLILLILVVLFSADITYAQENKPGGPIYVVQPGDTLWSIAQRFRVSVDDLTKINNIRNPNQLTEGMQLVIPGLEGIEGTLTTINVSYGDTLRSISRRYRIPVAMIARLNHIVSPMELFAGSTLVIPVSDSTAPGFSRVTLNIEQPLLELAVLHNQNPWKLVLDNEFGSSVEAIPGDVLLILGSGEQGLSGIPAEITSITINPSFPLQGKTSVIKIETQSQDELSFSGSFLGHELHFFPNGSGEYVSLQGVHAMTEPGIYPLQIQLQQGDSSKFTFSQMVNVRPVNYPYDRPLTVDPATIDPAVTKPEEDEWLALASTFTPEKMWDKPFQIPSPLPKDYCLETGDCWSSRFGNRRSYNGSAYVYFHTGLDVFGGSGTEIYAPAPGVVVFAGSLAIRGNATLIDHGWGVYTGYLHQSEILVKVGDKVEAGQLIGLVGGTGRVEGPHLHWELLVGGVQVDPLDWLSQVYP
jgi:murein DD-endopeptidase MepM/ murein hydrolase activator NlpD